MQQTVTTACHHCVDPACMNGCPVHAYEKDPVTGIVKHLDDQCIGCQYCIFTCPYEVPQYNAETGIVRKCDMCSRSPRGRRSAGLRAGLPERGDLDPRRRTATVVENAQADAFLPAAPSPGITLPTTRLPERERALPRNLLPADFYSVSPSHQHLPLVRDARADAARRSARSSSTDLLVAALVRRPRAAARGRSTPRSRWPSALLALGASTLHLGRPLYAFRARARPAHLVAEPRDPGVRRLFARWRWRTRACSWIRRLSAVTGVSALGAGSASASGPARASSRSSPALRGVLCSVMVYARDRAGASGTASRTGMRFFGTQHRARRRRDRCCVRRSPRLGSARTASASRGCSRASRCSCAITGFEARVRAATLFAICSIGSTPTSSARRCSCAAT